MHDLGKLESPMSSPRLGNPSIVHQESQPALSLLQAADHTVKSQYSDQNSGKDLEAVLLILEFARTALSYREIRQTIYFDPDYKRRVGIFD